MAPTREIGHPGEAGVLDALRTSSTRGNRARTIAAATINRGSGVDRIGELQIAQPENVASTPQAARIAADLHRGLCLAASPITAAPAMANHSSSKCSGARMAEHKAVHAERPAHAVAMVESNAVLKACVCCNKAELSAANKSMCSSGLATAARADVVVDP